MAKGMSGGRLVVRQPPAFRGAPGDNVILGNCALYGATGGVLFVAGRAGDRFAVRKSGATAVVEGTGLHCCEYMTDGLVVVLGGISHNAGAGMTGGSLWLPRDQARHVIDRYVVEAPFDEEALAELSRLLAAYRDATGSPTAARILDEGALSRFFARFVPHRKLPRPLEQRERPQTGSIPLPLTVVPCPGT